MVGVRTGMTNVGSLQAVFKVKCLKNASFMGSNGTLENVFLGLLLWKTIQRQMQSCFKLIKMGKLPSSTEKLTYSQHWYMVLGLRLA